MYRARRARQCMSLMHPVAFVHEGPSRVGAILEAMLDLQSLAPGKLRPLKS